jgi:methionine-gamma-lyase
VGEVDSLACHPATTTHSAVPEAIRQRNGVGDSLVRLSVGVEDEGDLLRDVSDALRAISA